MKEGLPTKVRAAEVIIEPAEASPAMRELVERHSSKAFEALGDPELAAALAIAIRDPEVAENITLADEMAKRLGELENKIYGMLKTPHATAAGS